MNETLIEFCETFIFKGLLFWCALISIYYVCQRAILRVVGDIYGIDIVEAAEIVKQIHKINNNSLDILIREVNAANYQICKLEEQIKNLSLEKDHE